MNILYFLYREDIYSPLVEGQVLNNLYRISEKSDINIHFLWLKRVDYCFKHRDKIQVVRDNLSKHGIILHEVPIIVGKFPLKKSMFDFVYFQAKEIVKRIIKKNNIDIVHTRGYNAGLFIQQLKGSGCKVKHVFDPRSPYITEIQSTYGVKQGTAIYEYWVKNEKAIVSNAEATVTISEDFGDYLKKLQAKTIYIPNNSEMDVPNIVCSRVNQQKRNSMCFVGSLGYGWNNILEYISFMKRVLEIDNTIKFELYVLQASRKVVEEEMKKSGIPSECYIIDSLPPNMVGKTISGCLAGLQIMSKRDTRLGIKTVDYLSAGVPVICNNNAVGAAKIIKDNLVGWNIDETDISLILNDIKSDDKSGLCTSVAYNNFSTEVVSERYYKLYKGL